VVAAAALTTADAVVVALEATEQAQAYQAVFQQQNNKSHFS
jgi:hypothetical protein